VAKAIALTRSDVAPTDDLPSPLCDELDRRVLRNEGAYGLERRRFEECEPLAFACYSIEATAEALDVFQCTSPYHSIRRIVCRHPSRLARCQAARIAGSPGGSRNLES
jgi:hypothetical protein